MKKIFLSKNFQIFLGLCGLLLTGFIMTQGLKNAMDIFFLDESSYLVRGSKMFGKISRKWGPMYAVWYRFLCVFETNKVDLFYLNFKLMSILSASFLFLSFSRLFKSILPALFVAFCFLISTHNLPIFPKISHYCLSGMLVALLLSTFFKDEFYKIFVFLIITLLLSFARNEFYLSFLFIIVLSLGLLATKRIVLKKTYLLPVLLFCTLAFMLHFALGNPLLMKMEGHNRSLVAFGEHFSYNYSQWNNIDQYLWLAWEEVFTQSFGEPTSLTASLKANPQLFFKHVLTNSENFIYEITSLTSSLLIPLKFNSTLSLFIGLVILVIVFIYFLLNSREALSIELILLVLLATPTIISCLLIYPRGHYIVLLVPLIAYLMMFALKQLTLEKQYNLIGILLLNIVFVFLTPKASQFKYFELRKKEGVLNNQLAIQLFEQSNLQQPVTMLSNEGDFNEYTSKQINWIVPNLKKGKDFYSFLNEQNPDLIYLTSSIFKNPNYANDTLWLQFLTRYEDFNYSKIILQEDITECFLAKREIIHYFN